MKVHELIAKLQKVNPDFEVVVSGRDDEYAYDVWEADTGTCKEGVFAVGSDAHGEHDCFILVGG